MSQETSSPAYLEIRIQPVFGPGQVDIYHHLSDGREQLVANFPGLTDEGEFEELVSVLKGALVKGPVNGIIDMSGFSWLNSSGLGKMLVLWKEFHAQKGRLVLVGPNPRVREVFRITKLEQVFTIVETLDEAIEVFEK